MWAQIYWLARRSVVRQSRQPANVVAPAIFPLGLLAVNAGGLQPATMIPGFPTDRFVAFALAVPFMQGALFATMNAGTDLARDIQTGFLNRLSLTPVRGVALITGQLAGVAVRCEHDEYDLAEIIRALDTEDLHFSNVQLHAPSLDDVFLAKTGRSLEGAAEEEQEAVEAS